jgi:cytochrome c oxidase subunit 3
MGIPISRAKLGMWLFLGTEIMFFTAFIGTYIVCFFGSPGWPTDTDQTHINIAAGGINTFVLISVELLRGGGARGHGAAEICQGPSVSDLHDGLAFVFLGIKSYEYKGKLITTSCRGRLPRMISRRSTIPSRR